MTKRQRSEDGWEEDRKGPPQRSEAAADATSDTVHKRTLYVGRLPQNLVQLMSTDVHGAADCVRGMFSSLPFQIDSVRFTRAHSAFVVFNSAQAVESVLTAARSESTNKSANRQPYTVRYNLAGQTEEHVVEVEPRHEHRPAVEESQQHKAAKDSTVGVDPATVLCIRKLVPAIANEETIRSAVASWSGGSLTPASVSFLRTKMAFVAFASAAEAHQLYGVIGGRQGGAVDVTLSTTQGSHVVSVEPKKSQTAAGTERPEGSATTRVANNSPEEGGSRGGASLPSIAANSGEGAAENSSSCTVFVAGTGGHQLPHGLVKGKLQPALSAGDTPLHIVDSVQMPNKKRFTFLEMQSAEEASAAIKVLDGMIVEKPEEKGPDVHHSDHVKLKASLCNLPTMAAVREKYAKDLAPPANRPGAKQSNGQSSSVSTMKPAAVALAPRNVSGSAPVVAAKAGRGGPPVRKFTAATLPKK